MRRAFIAVLALMMLAHAVRPQTAELVVQSGYTSYINYIAYSPDGRLMVIGDMSTLKLWDTATGSELRRLIEMHSDYVLDYRHVSFSPDWRLMVNSHSLTDTATGQTTKVFKGGAPVGSSSVVDPARLIFVSATDKLVQVWASDSGELKHQFVGRQMALDPTGAYFAAVGTVGMAVSASAASSMPANRPVIQELPPADDTVGVYSLATASPVMGLTGVGQPLKLMFSGDSRRLIIAKQNGIEVRDVLSAKTIASLTRDLSGLESLTVDSHGDSVVAAIADRATDKTRLVLWNASNRNATDIDAQLPGRYEYRRDVAFSPDGKLLVVAQFVRSANDPDLGKQQIRLIKTSTGEVLRTIEAPGTRTESPLLVVFNPDGRTFAIGRENMVDIRDVATGKVARTLRGFAHRVADVSIGLDALTIAATSSHQRVDSSGQLIGLSSGEAIRAGELLDQSTLLWSLNGTFSPARLEGAALFSNPHFSNSYINAFNREPYKHSRYLAACASRADLIRCNIWDTSSGRPVKIVDNLSAFFTGIKPTDPFAATIKNSVNAISGDVKRIAIASKGKEITMWDIADGRGYTLEPQPGDPNTKQRVPKKPMWTVDLSDPFLITRDTIESIEFSDDNKAVGINGGKLIFETETGKPAGMEGLRFDIPGTWPKPTGPLDFAVVNNKSRLTMYYRPENTPFVELYWLNNDDWVVAAADGRFDTNMDLDRIAGLNWVMSDEPYSPKPLELFMRDYYEPGLLARLMACKARGNCKDEFKRLPSIATINRVQPRLGRPKIRP